MADGARRGVPVSVRIPPELSKRLEKLVPKLSKDQGLTTLGIVAGASLVDRDWRCCAASRCSRRSTSKWPNRISMRWSNDLLKLSERLFDDYCSEGSFHALAAAAATAAGFFSVERLNDCRGVVQARLSIDRLSAADLFAGQGRTTNDRIWRPDYAALLCRIDDYYLPLANHASDVAKGSG